MTDSVNPETKTVHLVVAEVWKEPEGDSLAVHLLFVNETEEDVVTMALNVLANAGYEEAELHEIGTLDGEPDEEPHKSAWATALTGEVALIEFDS